ncbi:MAG: prolyl oligopeptidase family serine peptidase [Patescibacteria group bacterium]
MKRFKYIFIALIVIFGNLSTAEALDIQYGTVLGYSGSNILVEYSGIGKKKNFLCNTVSRNCSTTKKTALGTKETSALAASVRDELRNARASHITVSPSGNFVAYYKTSTTENQTRSFVIRDLKTGKEYSVSRPSTASYWDLVNDQARVFEFSPDGKKLIYLDDTDGAFALYSVDTTTLSETTMKENRVPLAAYQVDDFIFTDSDTLYYVGNAKDNRYLWSLYRHDFRTGKDSIVASKVSYVDSLLKIGSSIVFNQMQTRGFGLALYNTSSKKVLQFKIPGIGTKNTVSNEEVIMTENVHGVLMTPAKIDPSKTYPLLIWLHGGPYRQTSYGYHPFHSYGTYDSILQLLRKNNVVVLKLDYKGSYGFGRDFAEGLKGSVGTGDVENVMNAISYAKTRFTVGGVYLAGNSYGGYLSLRSIVEHPYSFTGVMSINGVTDWESLLTSLKTSIFNTHFNGAPDSSNKTLYDQASVVNRINILGNQKISLIQAQADQTIPPWQADFLYGKLKEQNKNVSIVKYEGEDHVFEKKSAISDLCIQMFNFVGVKPDKECKK